MKKAQMYRFIYILIIIIAFSNCNKKSQKRKVIEIKKPSTEGLLQNNEKDALPEITMTLAYLRSYYYDPTKLKPREMLYAGLNKLQSIITSLAFRIKDEKTFEIQIGKAKQTFHMKKLENLGDLNTISQSVLTFVLAELKKQTDDKDEYDNALYGFVNGMLDALDPYSILIRPKYNEEFQMQTRGAYAGVGMVLSIRDWELTVINPTPGAPAIKAGIKAGDKIVRINDRSTENMPLEEAVSMIRGEAGTSVDIWIRRKGWKEPKKFVLVRQRIKIQSVSAKMLPGNVGYFRINHFISNTYKDLKTNYSKLKKQAGGHLSGIILDLWSNPGGLLPQAIYVANAFTDKGMLVATEGAPGTKKHSFTADPAYVLDTKTPLVILISSNSASASEIVTGSLKNLDRALVLGETSYGKGTVQQIFSSTPDKPVLKLTIRQYLTAGNVSIQQVGVVPHIRITPIGIIDDVVSLFWPDKPRKVSKQNKRIKSSKVRPPEKPRYEIRYYKDKIKKKEIKNSVNDYGADDEIIETARKILLEAGAPKASETLNKAKNLVTSMIKNQEKLLITKLAAKNVDWTAGKPSPSKPVFSAQTYFCTFKDSECKKPLESVPTGEKIRFRLQIKNKGKAPIYRVYALTESPADFLDATEFVLGKIKAGASKHWDAFFKIPKSTSSAVEPYTVKLMSKIRGALNSVKKYVRINALEKPHYELFYSFNEVKGGDGIAQKNENFVIHIKVKNTGKTKSGKLMLLFKNHSGKDIFITKGRQETKELKPGEEFTGDLFYTIKGADKNLKAEIAVYDSTFRESVSRKIELPAGKIKHADNQKSATIVFPEGTVLWASAYHKFVKLGTVKGAFKVNETYEGYCRLNLPGGLAGFAKFPKMPAKLKSEKPEVKLISQIVPPTITLNKPPVFLTDKSEIIISGLVTHPEKVKDFLIIVANYDRDQPRKKVFFKTANGNKLQFKASVPLDKGVNYIFLIARYDKDLMSHKMYSVLKEK